MVFLSDFKTFEVLHHILLICPTSFSNMLYIYSVFFEFAQRANKSVHLFMFVFIAHMHVFKSEMDKICKESKISPKKDQ